MEERTGTLARLSNPFNCNFFAASCAILYVLLMIAYLVIGLTIAWFTGLPSVMTGRSRSTSNVPLPSTSRTIAEDPLCSWIRSPMRTCASIGFLDSPLDHEQPIITFVAPLATGFSSAGFRAAAWLITITSLPEIVYTKEALVLSLFRATSGL